MRRETDAFGDRELSLVFIARTLKNALRVEEVLTAAGVDYAVETDHYSAGFIFRRQRVGAFFYVAAEDDQGARAVLIQQKFTPFEQAS